LAVATLASQFFLSWCFIRIRALQLQRFGSIEVPTRTLFDIPITGRTRRQSRAIHRAHDRCGDEWLASN